MRTASAAVVLMGLALAGCGDRGEGRGPVTSETREVGSFEAIELEGAARLDITIGAPASLVIEAAEDTLDRVRTEVRGDTLFIETKPTDWFSSDARPRLNVKVTVPQLSSLKLEGGADVRVQGFNGGESRIRSEGAAHIKAAGRLDDLTVQLAGAGHADLTELVAGQASVTVDGVGSVYVHPTESLDATMNGVGAILYTGNPREVNTRMNGLGTIGRRESEEHEAEDRAPSPDPDTLQPEYEDPKPKQVGETAEVV